FEVGVTSVGAGVDYEEVEDLPHLSKDLPAMVDCYQIPQLGADGREQDFDPEGPIHHDFANEVRVHMLDVFDQVGDPLRVVQVQGHPDVAKLEIQIDQGHPGLGRFGHRHRQVGGDQRLAHPALARVEEADLDLFGALRGGLLGRVAGFLGGGGRGADLDVGLEGEQLLQVVQRARDVVDDQDFDQPVAHPGTRIPGFIDTSPIR